MSKPLDAISPTGNVGKISTQNAPQIPNCLSNAVALLDSSRHQALLEACAAICPLCKQGIKNVVVVLSDTLEDIPSHRGEDGWFQKCEAAPIRRLMSS